MIYLVFGIPGSHKWWIIEIKRFPSSISADSLGRIKRKTLFCLSSKMAISLRYKRHPALAQDHRKLTIQPTLSTVFLDGTFDHSLWGSWLLHTSHPNREAARSVSHARLQSRFSRRLHLSDGHVSIVKLLAGKKNNLECKFLVGLSTSMLHLRNHLKRSPLVFRFK